MKPTSANIIQVILVIIASGAAAWGIFALLSVISPGGSGEWTIMALGTLFVVNVPIGSITLVGAFAANGGNQRLRKLVMIVSATALAMPVIVSAVFRLLR